jgi:CBS domain-containing protein
MAERNSGNSRTVRDFMTRDPECVREQDAVRDAALIMKGRDTGVVPVVDGKKVVGVITDRDIVVRGIADGKDLETARVADIMSRQVQSVRDDTPAHEALKMMSRAEIRRLPVVDGNDEIVGILSIGDIAAEGNQEGRVGQTMEDISEAPPNN